MKFTAALLVILLLLGYASAMRITMDTYANDACTGISSSVTVDIKSGKCATGVGKFKRSGNNLEFCAYTDAACSTGESCSSVPIGQCVGGIVFNVLGSASSVAFSGVFIAVAALFALAF